MRKVILQMQLSLDNFVADADGKTDWMIWNWGIDWTWDEDLKKYFIDLSKSIDTILLSGNMANEGFIDHWNAISKDIHNPQSQFASQIDAARKIVFTKKIKETQWTNTEIQNGKLSEEVNKLKNRKEKDMIVYGGSTFASALIKENLVDEFYLFICQPRDSW